MKRHYVKPSLDVVKIQQRSCMLTGSVMNVVGNTDIDYGGGGHGDAMVREHFDEFDIGTSSFDY